ncbi:MAG TPA: CoA transferase [Mycobacteriales bacterium]|jgi:hypothetical protein|nr:CoA transferase [Mycobacteriales bacterium]
MTANPEIAAWARSGAMALTGRSDGPPQLVAGAPATTVRRNLEALSATAAAVGLDPPPLPDERLLGERAAVMGLRRQGRVSAGGATRLLDAADGTVALTLSRQADLEVLPALLERNTVSADPWHDVAAWAAVQDARDIEERAALLGLAIGAVHHSVEAAVGGLSTPLGRPPRAASANAPLVVDLSALWAGPLCAHLLGLVGAQVLAVESTQRPDPTRDVAPGFHALLRGNAEHCSLDFTSREDVARLRDLLVGADIVIEAARPRALAQLGIDAHEVAAEGHGTWVSITAYGRAQNRIGYGDDVAAAAGLLGEGPVFAGDAVADPMTGTHAALAALSHWAAGHSGVVELSMYDVVHAARTPLPESHVVRRGDDWYVDDGSELHLVRRPVARQAIR